MKKERWYWRLVYALAAFYFLLSTLLAITHQFGWNDMPELPAWIVFVVFFFSGIRFLYWAVTGRYDFDEWAGGVE